VDADLYVTDETGAVVAKSQTWGTANEAVVLTPPAGEYRFEKGAKYTIWVHGYGKPGTVVFPPSDVHLNITWDALNLWLSAEHPDVHVSAIGAGEMVSVTLHFDKPGWSPGDPDLSARLLAGPSVLPGAFDELVTIERDDPPGAPVWSSDNLDVSVTADSIRGAGSAKWSIGGVPIPTALVAAGERVTYTVSLENLDPLDSPNLYVDAWPLPEDYVCMYFGLCTDQVDGVAYGLITGTLGTFDYGGGIEWTGPISSGDSIEFSYWVEMPADMAPGDNHTSGVDVYEGTSYLDPWIGWGLAGGYDRAFDYGFDGDKMSSAYTVVAGETFTYTIHFENYSAEDRYIYFSDPLPDEVTYVSATGGATYDAGTHAVTWLGFMPGGTNFSDAVVDFDIVVQAKSDLKHNTLIVNEATVANKQDGTPVAYLYAYTYASMSTSLSVEKTVDIIGGYGGDLLTYNIVIHNTGDHLATNAVMTDVIPSYLTVVTDSLWIDKGAGAAFLPEDVYDEDTGILRWEGDMAAGDTYTITFQTTIDEGAPAEWAIINPAEFVADNAATVYNSALTEVFELPIIYLPIIMRNG